jgi:hypothetical protein
VIGQCGQFIGSDVAAIDEELADTHQPFFVIPIFEVFERLHVLGTGTQ